MVRIVFPRRRKDAKEKINRMTKKITRFISLCLLCATWAGLAHAADTIRIAYSSVNPHALLVSLAEKRGLYAKYGLSSVVVYIPGGSTVIQGMVSGDIDLGQLTGSAGRGGEFARRGYPLCCDDRRPHGLSAGDPTGDQNCRGPKGQALRYQPVSRRRRILACAHFCAGLASIPRM